MHTIDERMKKTRLIELEELISDPGVKVSRENTFLKNACAHIGVDPDELIHRRQTGRIFVR
jgi:hypothetical protein